MDRGIWPNPAISPPLGHSIEQDFLPLVELRELLRKS
jgi:hypothetical protein